MIWENLAFRIGWWGTNQSDSRMEISIGFREKVFGEIIVCGKGVWGN